MVFEINNRPTSTVKQRYTSSSQPEARQVKVGQDRRSHDTNSRNQKAASSTATHALRGSKEMAAKIDAALYNGLLAYRQTFLVE